MSLISEERREELRNKPVEELAKLIKEINPNQLNFCSKDLCHWRYNLIIRFSI